MVQEDENLGNEDGKRFDYQQPSHEAIAKVHIRTSMYMCTWHTHTYIHILYLFD